MRELLAGLVPGLPEQAVATIVARADGIPLYAVETVRMLVAEGRLVEEDGVYVPRGDLTELGRAGDADRADRRRASTASTTTDRRIVHDAAVLGQSFTARRPWRRLPVSPRTSSSRAWRSLVRRELLAREIDPRSPERGQYALRPGAHPRGRLQHAGQEGPQEAAPGRGALLRVAGQRRARRRARRRTTSPRYANAAEGAEADALAGQARIALKAAADARHCARRATTRRRISSSRRWLSPRMSRSRPIC